MNFKPSLILKVTNQADPLDSFIKWSNKNLKTKLTKDNTLNNPNLVIINAQRESIKIEKVREVKAMFAYGAYQARKTRYFVFLDAHLTTIEAQNALLKSIEEPPTNTQIILVTHTPSKLLETIISRCTLITLEKSDLVSSDTQVKQLYTNILTSSHGERIALASNYKDRVEAVKLCSQMIDFLHQELVNPKTNTQQISHNIKVLLETIKYLEANVNVLLALENCFFRLN